MAGLKARIRCFWVKDSWKGVEGMMVSGGGRVSKAGGGARVAGKRLVLFLKSQQSKRK
jgi:hypothetical protein